MNSYASRLAVARDGSLCFCSVGVPLSFVFVVDILVLFTLLSVLGGEVFFRATRSPLVRGLVTWPGDVNRSRVTGGVSIRGCPFRGPYLGR